MKSLYIILGVLMPVSSGLTAAHTNVPCSVNASGFFPGGETFSGSFTEDGTGVFDLDWRHSAPSIEFEASETDPNSVSCNINGDVNADVIGFGTATVNGVGGYSYTLYMEDNRAAPENLILSASIVRTPTRRTEGVVIFDPPQPVPIPASLDITYGASGPGWTKLHLDDVICRYRGTGTSYDLERCTGPGASEYSAGDFINVSNVRLRIQSADPAYEMTSVDAVIGFGDPATGSPDFYEIEVFNPGNESVYFFSGGVDNGDISINLLPAP